MDTRVSTYLLLAILIATCAAVLLAGCTGTPSGGSNQTSVPTTLAGNTSAANASAAPGANQTAAGLGAIMAGTPVQEASVPSVQKATPAGAPTSGTTPVSPTPTKCTSDFTASVTSGVAPLTVTFTATAPCAAQKRSWNFGDGGPMASIEGGKVETYTYATPGTYTVKLYEKFYSDDPADTQGFYGGEKEKVGYITVTGTTTATGTASPTGTASVGPTPTKCTSDFTASVTSGVAPLTVTFTATAPCAAQKRSWNFGDGGPMASIEGGKVETYTYATPGTYTVKLYEKFYSDDPADTQGFYGGEKEKIGFITVSGTTSSTGTAVVSPTPTHCQADFTASVTSGPAPLTVTFTRTAPCASQKRSWNFGDSGPMSSIEGGPVETYTYETPGTYTVSLYEKFYTDDNIEGFYGDTETKVGYITVTGKAVSPTPTHCKTDFTADITSGPAPLTVTFTSTSPCDSQKCIWWFADNGPMSTIEGGKVQTYTFEKAGTFTVRLSEKFYGTGSEDYYLDIKEKSDYIHVTDGPVIKPSLRLTVFPTIKVTPKITLIKPGVTLVKDKKEIIVNPVGPVSGNG